MTNNDPKYVTEPVLTYYHTRIKDYIDKKAVQPHEVLESRVDTLEVTTSVNSANIVSHREELDDIESALVILQEEDKEIRKDISDIRVILENIEGTTTCDVTKEYVDTRIEEAIDSLQIPDTENLVTKSELDDTLEGFLVEEDLKQLTDAVANVEAALDEKANIQDIPDVSKFITEIPSEYVTQEDLSSYATKDEIPKDYLVAEDISNKADRSELFSRDYNDLNNKPNIPSIEGLATEEFVNDAINNIEYPTTDLSKYSTTDEMHIAINAATSVKADDVPFATSMFVTQPIGGFDVGDDLIGLTISEIFTKLLNLSDKPVVPDIPEEPSDIVDKIIQDNLGMYQINEYSEAVPILYTYKTFDSTSYANVPSEDCFYQLLDEGGNVLESGYQHVSDENDSMYYVIALPQGVTFNDNVTVTVWDNTSDSWVDVTNTLHMSSDVTLINDVFNDAGLSVPVIPEGYTLWIDTSFDTCTGSDYRFIIN